MFKAEILTLPPKSPIENVGLGPAAQDSRTQKNGCFVCCFVLCFCVWVGQTEHFLQSSYGNLPKFPNLPNSPLTSLAHPLLLRPFLASLQNKKDRYNPL